MTLTPVFIAGCDRSGTTMLGDILGAGSNSFSAPESQWVHDLLMMMHVSAFASSLEAARWLKAHFRFAVWGTGKTDEELAALLDMGNARVSIENILSDYLQCNGKDPASAPIWCDHTPDNFKRYNLIKNCFPEAKFIHIVRDGRAVFQSIKTLNWGPNNAYMGSRYWVERLQQAIAVEMAEGSNCLVVRYEDFLRKPEEQLRRICDFSGVEYSESMLDGGGVILPEFTLGQHKLVGKRPDASRAETWRAALTQTEISEFEGYDWTRVLMKSYGYELMTDQPCQISAIKVLYRYLHEYFLYIRHRASHRKMEDQTVDD